MKFTLLAATAFVAGALAAPYSPAPPAYDNKKCDSVKKSYLDCQKLQDKDYSQWQTCKSNEDKQKKEYDLCISIQYKFEGSYKQCTKSEQDEKKHYDECKVSRPNCRVVFSFAYQSLPRPRKTSGPRHGTNVNQTKSHPTRRSESD